MKALKYDITVYSSATDATHHCGKSIQEVYVSEVDVVINAVGGVIRAHGPRDGSNHEEIEVPERLADCIREYLHETERLADMRRELLRDMRAAELFEEKL